MTDKSVEAEGYRSAKKGSLAGHESSHREAWMGLLSGMAFGLVSPVVGHPLDTVKTKMQTQYSDQRFSSVVRLMYKNEGGLRAFYRGFLPPLAGSLLYRGALFSAYSGAYSASERYSPVLSTPIPFTGGLRPSVIIGGMSAAFARSVIESPFDFVKVRWMLGQKSGFSGNTNPLLHMYKGFVPTLCRTMGLVGSFFIMVDYSVRYIPDVINAPFFGPFFKGGICATAAWTFAFPFETAKSLIQSSSDKASRTMLQVLMQLYREKGIIRGWYRGFGPGAGRSFLANGASMVAYQYFQTELRK